MKRKILVRAADARPFKVDAATTIMEFFSAADLPEASLVTVRLTGRHGRRTNVRSAKLIHLTAGALTVQIEGQTYELFPGDSLLIRPNREHAMEGKAAVFVLVCAPAFNAAWEEVFVE